MENQKACCCIPLDVSVLIIASLYTLLSVGMLQIPFEYFLWSSEKTSGIWIMVITLIYSLLLGITGILLILGTIKVNVKTKGYTKINT